MIKPKIAIILLDGDIKAIVTDKDMDIAIIDYNWDKVTIKKYSPDIIVDKIHKNFKFEVRKELKKLGF